VSPGAASFASVLDWGCYLISLFDLVLVHSNLNPFFLFFAVGTLDLNKTRVCLVVPT
jgi:hypothetical protein